MHIYDTEGLPHLIGIEGQMCAGKDFIADQLISKLGYRRLNFADPLKADVAEKHGITVAELNARKSEFRSELQEYGERMRRDVNEDYWVDRWFDMVLNVDGPIVVCDVRYINESRMLHERGAWLLQVRVPYKFRIDRICRLYGEPTQEQLTHPSETNVPRLLHHTIVPGNIPSDDIIPTLVSKYKEWEFIGSPSYVDLSNVPELFGIAVS